MKIADFRDKNILILGFAREGISVLTYLRKTFPDKKIVIYDQLSKQKFPKTSLKILEKDSNLEFKLGVAEWKKLKNWDKFDVIIKSAGIPLKNLPKEVLPKLTSETQIFFEQCPGKIVGVTGTKGKSTTSSLIFEVLKTAGTNAILLGNIGKPALDYLDEIDSNTSVVFELSSHQLQTLKSSPHIAILLNIFPEHLDYYKDFADYLEAKLNIASFQNSRDFLIINEDFKEFKKAQNDSNAQIFPIGKKFYSEVIEIQKKSKLLGSVNLLNILAAKRVAQILGISDEIFTRAIQSFQPLEHRMERVGIFKKIRFYNDSLATIPEATIAALEALGNDVETIFLGGFDRGVDYKLLAETIKKSQLKNLIFFPTTGEKIWKELQKIDRDSASKFKVFKTENMKDAVKFAYKNTRPGKIALLSCASTSFNLFKDYADRGNQFKEQVEKQK